MSAGQQNSRRSPPQAAGSQGDAPSKPADWEGLKEDVNQIADAAVQRGLGFVESAKTQATEYVDRRKGDAAKSVTDLANALRESAKSFEERPNIGAFFHVAADGLEQLADTIEARSFNDIYGEAEDLLRRRPGTAAAATFIAGFVLSRFIKASAETVREGARRPARPNPAPVRRPGAQARAGE